MSALELFEVSVRYGDTVALDHVSLSVASGEVVAVVGPSGCGKSTLLRAVAGLEPLTSGRISLGGRELVGVPTHQRDLGLMFQDHVLFPHLTVGDNIGFGLKMKGESTNSVAALLDLVGLAGFADRTIDQLSGGEAQRVALARAVAPSPGLLMLDEPLGSLDRVLREQLTGDLRRLITELGLTALHVTHDQAEAFALADRVVVLRDGRVEQLGTPADLWHKPDSVFVAGFLGHPNVWPRSDHAVLVTVPSLRPASQNEGADRTGLVELVEFRDGRFRVTARSNDRHPGEPLVFESASRVDIGAAVSLVVTAEVAIPDPPHSRTVCT
jgi:thiamine transport system ATP-binding protein